MFEGIERAARTPRRRLMFVLGAVLALVLGCGLGSPAAARAANLTGTWEGAYHCEVGWCAGSDFPAKTELYEASACGDVIGTNGSESISGTLVGNTYTTHSETGAYKSEGVLTLSAEGNNLEGKTHDNNGTEGTTHMTRVSSSASNVTPYTGCKTPNGEKPAEEKPPQHGSGMTVMCNLDELTLQDTCTATLADTAGLNPTGPTGAVTFSSSSGGFFPFGTKCTLHSSTSAPSMSYCSVQYVPAAGASFPNVSASYPGDASHGPASGSTRFIMLGSGVSGYDESTPASVYPNEVSVEVNVPAEKSVFEAGVNKGETKPPPPTGRKLRAREDPDIIPEMLPEVEEREREERYPDIIPSMRKEVEEREIQYEKDIAELRREINEEQRRRAGLNAEAQAEQNALLAADEVVLQQIKQQENSPGLKKDPASAAALAKLAKEQGELEREMSKALELQRRQITGAIGATKSSVGPGTLATVAAKRRSHAGGTLISLGHARITVAHAGKVKLRIHLNKALELKLLKGRNSLKVNLRLLVIVPSHVLRPGRAIGIVRSVTLHAPTHAHRKH